MVGSLRPSFFPVTFGLIGYEVNILVDLDRLNGVIPSFFLLLTGLGLRLMLVFVSLNGFLSLNLKILLWMSFCLTFKSISFSFWNSFYSMRPTFLRSSFLGVFGTAVRGKADLDLFFKWGSGLSHVSKLEVGSHLRGLISCFAFRNGL
jgi:hypothetical protein